MHVTVFLVSLKAGGVALNLTEASRVYLMDSWWNPAVEYRQCISLSQIRIPYSSPLQRPWTVYIVLASTVLSKLLSWSSKTVSRVVSSNCRRRRPRWLMPHSLPMILYVHGVSQLKVLAYLSLTQAMGRLTPEDVSLPVSLVMPSFADYGLPSSSGSCSDCERANLRLREAKYLEPPLIPDRLSCLQSTALGDCRLMSLL